MLNSPKGVPVNAVHGVLSMMLKLMTDYKPTHILVAKDEGKSSFRNEIYDQYKANRSDPPEELIPQFELISKLIDHMQLPVASNKEYEADDIIGSACVQWIDDFDEILIASGDKDLMQFVGNKIKMVDTMKSKIYDPKGVSEKMGVHPEQIVDYLSMVGDVSDNIPGMKGVGAKTAAKLLSQYGTLEECIKNKDKFKGKKLIEAFSTYLEDALLSKKLIQIKRDLNLSHDPKKLEFRFTPSDKLLSFLEELGFRSSLRKLKEFKQGKIQSVESEGKFKNSTDVLEKNFDSFLIKLKNSKQVACYSHYESQDVRGKALLYMALDIGEDKVYFLNFEKLPKLRNYLAEIWKILLTQGKFFTTAHLQNDLTFAFKNLIRVSGHKNLFDVTQAHFVCDPGGNHSLNYQSREKLNKELFQIDKKKEVSHDDWKKFCSNRAEVIGELKEVFEKELKDKKLEALYYEMDQPLQLILAEMEFEGIEVDSSFFKKYEKELKEKLDKIEGEVSKYSQEKVNLNSPKQVGKLLFEQLKLPIIKKTKTGPSTDSEVLEELALKEKSDVADLILQYREIGKILSTYVSALPELISFETGRLHTHFNQHIAATGRLSSTHPNLQNIPIRSELGKKVRRGFVAGSGKVLFGADYSQVELRLLAHFSQDPTMIDAFRKGVDIHAQTASEIMVVALKDVTASDRSKAKAVNFGLMYGQSSFGLSRALKISRKEAKDYIQKYFERFSKIKGFLDTLKEACEETGYCETLMGRKRYIPDIRSSNRTVKANAERMAINSPIQGTAADLLKMAMLDIQKILDKEYLPAKMLLQVHDELIFEVEKESVDELEKLVKEKMENIAKLKVPLKVDSSSADNWFDLK